MRDTPAGIFEELDDCGRTKVARINDFIQGCAPRAPVAVAIGSALFDKDDPLFQRTLGQVPRSGPGIYYVMARSGDDAKKCWDAYCVLKEKAARENANRKRDGLQPLRYAKTNQDGSNCLYVGSCMQGLQQRLNQHLGHDPGPSSLKLLDWFAPLNIEIDFVYAMYPPEMSVEALKLLEKFLWEKLQPMFGQNTWR